MKALFISLFFSTIASAAPKSYAIQCWGQHFDNSGIDRRGEILIKTSSDGQKSTLEANWLQDQTPIMGENFVCGMPVKEACDTIVNTYGSGGHPDQTNSLEISVNCGKGPHQAAIALVKFGPAKWTPGKIDCQVRDGNWWGIELYDCVDK